MNPKRYAMSTAIDMASQVRRGELSPVELVRAAIDAIASTEPELNAYSEVFEQAALKRAGLLEVEARRHEFRGPLHGVPIAVKDLFQVEGTLTRRGSRLYADAMSTDTGPAVERLLAAGAVMVGKNTTPELGWKATSNSPLYGVTRNPWDPSRTTGGSSSGSAAAVAAGTVPISLGSDGGGSMRIPASFCGVFSLKASLGRVPTYPLSPTEHLSHAGPITRSVADCALALDVLKGPDHRDPNSLPHDGVSYLSAIAASRKSFRVGFAPTLFGRAVQPDISACIDRAFQAVRQNLPVQAVDLRLGWQDPIEIFEALWTARGALYKHLPETDKARLDPGFLRMVELSKGISVDDHFRTLQARARFCRTVAESFEDIDILLLPAVPIDPFAAELDGPADMDPLPAVPWARWTPFSYPFNLTGQPAASIPCGWSDAGYPVGLQVVGKRFDDATVLQFCAAWERHFDWHSMRPTIFAGV